MREAGKQSEQFALSSYYVLTIRKIELLPGVDRINRWYWKCDASVFQAGLREPCKKQLVRIVYRRNLYSSFPVISKTQEI